MPSQGFNRKLAAILHADVKGYSRLMGEDEEATVSTLTSCMEVMNVLIERHQGNIVGGAGDSLLAEFVSVVNAVRCAVEIQEHLEKINDEFAEDRKVVFRIGINLGDVIEKDGDLLGDGVNIAARVEALADGGGICITRSAYDQVKTKPSFLELPSPLPSSISECHVEMENRNGERIRMHFTGEIGLDLLVLSRDFWTGKP